MSSDDMRGRHRLMVAGTNVTAVRERVERMLGVTTSTRPEGENWAVYFDAPPDVNLDFLRPDVLPPRATFAEFGTFKQLPERSA